MNGRGPKLTFEGGVLVTGSAGSLGTEFLRALGDRATGLDLPELDITDSGRIREVTELLDPEWIINCAALTDVDLCQRDPDLAFRVNSDAVAALADTGRKLITFSTDHVFGGDPDQSPPFDESVPESPVNVYGASKLRGERAAMQRGTFVIIIRTSWLFSRRKGLLPFLWGTLAGDGRVTAVVDQVSGLTYAPDLVRATVELAQRGEAGIYHAVSPPALTPFDLAMMLSESIGGEVTGVTWDELGRDAPRPGYSFLTSEKGVVLPGAWDAIQRWRNSNV